MLLSTFAAGSNIQVPSETAISRALNASLPQFLDPSCRSHGPKGWTTNLSAMVKIYNQEHKITDPSSTRIQVSNFLTCKSLSSTVQQDPNSKDILTTCPMTVYNLIVYIGGGELVKMVWSEMVNLANQLDATVDALNTMTIAQAAAAPQPPAVPVQLLIGWKYVIDCYTGVERRMMMLGKKSRQSSRATRSKRSFRQASAHKILLSIHHYTNMQEERIDLCL
jgi:hypothetical protein